MTDLPDLGPFAETIEDWCRLASALKALIGPYLSGGFPVAEVIDEALTLALAAADTLEMEKAITFVTEAFGAEQ